MKYKLLQAYKDHSIDILDYCPNWIHSLVSDGEVDCFYLMTEDGENLAGYIALQGGEDGAEILDMASDDEAGSRMLLRRTRQYMQERGLTSLTVSKLIDQEGKAEWKRLLLKENFILEDGPSFYKINLKSLASCSLFGKMPQVEQAVESGRIRKAVGLEGKERDSLIALMDQTHPDGANSGIGFTLSDLSGVYVHNGQVLAYIFMSLYQGQLFVEECGAQKGMEPLVLALINHMASNIGNILRDAKEFYVPFEGDFGTSQLFKKMLAREDFNASLAQVLNGYWDPKQDLAMRQAKELPTANEEETGTDLGAIVVSRTEQLHDLLNHMDRENLLTIFRNRPCVQFWFNSKGQEETIYLTYHLRDVDRGDFTIEAIVPLMVCQDQEEGDKICRLHNSSSPSSTVFLEEERLYLRMSIIEHEYPINEEQLTLFIESLMEEWESLI